MLYTTERAKCSLRHDAASFVKHSIIYLPGFNSGPQSAKSSQLKIEFPDLIVATYDTWHPHQGYVQLEALITPYLQDDLILIGSSLGGFWSYYFACKHSFKCVLLNPCMTPESTLSPYLGEVQNRYSGEKGFMTPEDLARYEQYRFTGAPKQCTVLHQKGDELIPYQESIDNFQHGARLVLLEGGSHDFESLPTAIAEIRRLQSL